MRSSAGDEIQSFHRDDPDSSNGLTPDHPPRGGVAPLLADDRRGKRRNRRFNRIIELARHNALTALVIACLLFGSAMLLKQIPDSSVTVSVDLTVDSPGVAELFLNVESGGQYQQAPVSTGRQTLVFRHLRGPIRSLRVDPIDGAKEHATIHRVTVTGAGGRLLTSFSGDAFAKWTTYNSTDIVVDANGLSLTTTLDAAASVPVNITTGGGRPDVVETLVQWIEQPWLGNSIVLGLPIILLGVGVVISRRFAALPLVIGPAAVFLAVKMTRSTSGITKADRAFGNPGWAGLNAAYGQHFLLLTSALVVVLTVPVLLVRRQLPMSVRRATNTGQAGSENTESDNAPYPASASEPNAATDEWSSIEEGARTEEQEGEQEEEKVVASLDLPMGQRLWNLTRRVTASKWFAVFLVPFVYACIRLPSAKGVSASLSAPLSPQSWDEANLRTWDHLFAVGLRPMVDFWYPYGNLIYLRAGVVGACLEWLGETLCLVAFSYCLWQFAHRTCPVIIGTSAIAALDMQFFTGGLRYLFPLAAAGLFAVTRRNSGQARWLGLAGVAVAPFIAVDVGVYTLAAAASAIVVDELYVRGLGGSRTRQRLLADGATITLSWAAFVAVSAVRGGLSPSLALVLDQRSTSAYVGSITSVATSIRATPRIILYAFPFAAIALGLYGSIRRRGRTLNLSWIPITTCLGVYAVLLLAKHLIRPGLDGSLAMVCAAVIAIAIAAGWNTARSTASALAAGALLGGLCIQAQASDHLALWRTDLAHAPARAVDLLGAATWNRANTVIFHAALSPHQMSGLSDETAVADRVMALSPGGRMFVLGDSQYLYPLTGKRPYWIISMWDASPLREQRHVLRELESEPPDVVVVDRRDGSFDGVPSVLRVPLLYQWAAQHYALNTSIGPYDVLTRIAPGQSPAWQYWQSALGTTIDLGRLPAAATAAGPPCSTGQNDCLTYLELDVADVAGPTQRQLTVTGPSGSFTLTFNQWHGDRQLRIPLGRLWFWTAGSTVSPVGDGWVVRNAAIQVTGSVLY